MTISYDYFDETYYQGRLDAGGHNERGTAYAEYIENSRQNACFREIASNIVRIFQPNRVLEVGCAIGAIVRFLNDLGCEAHGAEVSEWCVAHREHPNVVLGGFEKLPFPDDYFDLVFSVHSIEHVPPGSLSLALTELHRVCPKGIQLHFLPLVGSGPYTGDRQRTITQLRADPTHYNLYDRDEWFEKWQENGWKDTGLQIIFVNDTQSYEITGCQLFLTRAPVDSTLVRRVSDINASAARMLFYRHRSFLNRSMRFSAAEIAVLSANRPDGLVFDGHWRGINSSFKNEIDLTDAIFRATFFVDSSEEVFLRFAFVGPPDQNGGGADAHVMEYWKRIPPGSSFSFFTRSEMHILRGSPHLSSITSINFGGEAKSAVVHCSLVAIQGDREQELLSTVQIAGK